MKSIFFLLAILFVFLLTNIYIYPFVAPKKPLPTISPVTTPVPTLSKQTYSCPKTAWVDCLPGPGPTKPLCQKEFLNWAKANCPDFKGAALWQFAI